MRIILPLLFCLSLTASFAQTSDAEAEALVNLLGVQKKELISKLVMVSKRDSAAFWKVYDEYQQKNKVTAKSRIKLYERTAYAYQAMTPAMADSLAGKYFANRVEQEKMLEQYYQKVKAATNPITAFEFYQAEIYLLNKIRESIMQQIPTYGQVKQMVK
ncbi:MAG: hypothetical protein JST14_01920 [Bacteroidetes bacterium]|nr:hypothetical protein [Bacteroidota bacterium]MBS1978542.1 hypothetical protein [Bacteroidota bacterium]